MDQIDIAKIEMERAKPCVCGGEIDLIRSDVRPTAPWGTMSIICKSCGTEASLELEELSFRDIIITTFELIKLVSRWNKTQEGKA